MSGRGRGGSSTPALGLTRFNTRLRNMINKFSDNSIEAAEQLGVKMDDIANSMSGECEDKNKDDEIKSEDAENGQVFIGNDNRRFFDYVLQNAPELYDYMGKFGHALNDHTTGSQKVTAIANFFDPMANFGDSIQIYTRDSERMVKARNRNYRLDLRQNREYQMQLMRGSSTPEGLYRHLDSEIEVVKQNNRYAD